MDLATVLLLIYLVVVIVIGYFARVEASDDDFVIAGRKVDALSSTASIFATMLTESVVFFSVGLAARFGPIGAMGAALGPCLALLVLSFFAHRARSVAEDRQFVCVSEFCRMAWGPTAGRMAKVVINAMLIWVVILQIHLNSAMLEQLLGWSQETGTLVTVGVVTVYIVLGGYRAVLKTDVFQTLVLLVILVAPFFMKHRPTATVLELGTGTPLDAVLLCLTSFSLTIVRPEMWQRIYSASSGAVAARSMRMASVLFVVVSGMILYYACAVVEVMPGVAPVDAFVGGYSQVLYPTAAAIVPVFLLAAMMSSLDSAAFLFSMNMVRLRARWAAAPRLWGRVAIVLLLLGAGIASLYIFEALAFAYKINGFIMIFTIPLAVSLARSLEPTVLVPALLAGLAVYVAQIAIGRIDANPSEAILGSLTTGVVLGAGLLFRHLRPSRW